MSAPASDDPTFVALPQLTLDEAAALTDAQLAAVFGGDMGAVGAVTQVAEDTPDAA